MKKQLRSTREARVKHRLECSVSGMQDQAMRDANGVVTNTLGTNIGTMMLDPVESDGPRDTSTFVYPVEDAEDVALPDLQRGAQYWTKHRLTADHPLLVSGSVDLQGGYHMARAASTVRVFPGSAGATSNPACCLLHTGNLTAQNCPYCKQYLGLAASCTWPSTLEAAMFYKPQTLVQFSLDRIANIDPGGNVALGTRPFGAFFNYKPKANGGGGPASVDVAWIQADGDQFKSCYKIACYIKHRSGSLTCSQNQLHEAAIADLLHECARPDNARPIPEEPRLPFDKQPQAAMRNEDGQPLVGSNIGSIVKIARYRYHGIDNTQLVPSSVGNVAPAGHQHLARHPRSNVPDTMLQRNIDSMFHGGRLCALNIFTTNRITVSPPIRLHENGLEVNVGALHDHVALMAEAVLVCSEIAGLHNMQEVFCHNQPGPDGLSAPAMSKADAPPADAQAGGKRTNAGASGASGASGAREGNACNNVDSKNNFVMPYSYDVAGTALSWDMLGMMYDDDGIEKFEDYMAMYKEGYGMDIKFEQLPHASMRYVGYAPSNRQTLSMKLPSAMPQGQTRVEAGDPALALSHISKEHVQRSLGRLVSDEEMTQYISRRQGSRSMKGVTGDLFASSTWYKHALRTLTDRGLIRGDEDEPAVIALGDMEICMQARIAEYACAKGVGIFKDMKLTLATPGTYSALVEARKKQAAQSAAASKNASGEPPTKVVCHVHRPRFNTRKAPKPNFAMHGILPPAAAGGPSNETLQEAADGLIIGAGPVPMNL
jgi:hypothetical protein